MSRACLRRDTWRACHRTLSYRVHGTDRGGPTLALDAVDAGIRRTYLAHHERFFRHDSRRTPKLPIDSAVIGVIDSVDLHDK